MIKRLIFSVIIGLMVTLFFAQYDPWVQEKIGKLFKESFENALNCTFSFRVRGINFFMPRIDFEDVYVHSNDKKEWSWFAKQYSTGFTWSHLFGYGIVDMWVDVNNLEAQSTICDEAPAILDHIYKLMEGPDLFIPMFLKSIVLRKASLAIHDQNIQAQIQWSSESKKIGNHFRSSIYIRDGFFDRKGYAQLNNYKGNLFLDSTKKSGKTQCLVRSDCRFGIPQFSNDFNCFLTGVWDQNYGRFAIRSNDGLVSIDPIIITKKNNQFVVQITANLPFSYGYRFLTNQKKSSLEGSCLFRAHGTVDKCLSLDGYLAIENIHSKNFAYTGAAKCAFHKRKSKWTGNVDFRIPSIIELSGSGQWDQDVQKGDVTLSNNTVASIPVLQYWNINPHDFVLSTTIDATGLNGNYQCLCNNTLLNTIAQSGGNVSLVNQNLYASGTLLTNSYEFEADLSVFPYLKEFKYWNENKESLININKIPDQQSFQSSIQFNVIRSLLLKAYNYDVQGEGSFVFNTVLYGEKVKTKIHLQNGIIRLPQTYNFIDGFDVDITYDSNRKLVIKNMHCALHTGSISSSSIIVYFDATGKCSFVHAPILFDKCLLNIRQDLFSMVSGTINVSKTHNELPIIKGCLMLDRSQLKENILSAQLQKQLFQFSSDMFDMHPNMLCDISIETKDPVRIDTPFLNANAKVNLAIKKSIVDPEISGLITVFSGNLKFPYRPLHINRGIIRFLPEQKNDPIVELTAKNKIKKYNVTLHVSGSLLNHSIILETTPPLTQEQAVALLLVGSEEDSLSIMMPALIAQNMKNLIFGSNQSDILERYIKPLVRPFNINLVPSFSDQTGRGGLRGALEIEVNNQWRALIQKNFSLTEDTRFELEYLLSDDISFRAIRDERRDVATEVEVRWKW